MRLRQIVISLDQLVNAIHGGWADETISSRAYRLRYRMPYRFYRWLIDTIFFLDPDHCAKSYQSERERAHLPPEFRA